MNPPRPSGSHQWSVCHGSHRMQVGQPPQPPSDPAEEGTAAHWLAEQVLNAYINDKPIPVATDYITTLSENGIVITQEMWDGVDEYVTDILKSIRGDATLRNLHVERKLDLDFIYPGMKGSCDAYLYNAKANHLTAWDFKFGHGGVEVIRNPQLMLYAAGIIAEHDLSDVNITLKIVQPRSYHSLGSIRSWQITSKHLDPLVADLSKAAHIAMSESPSCISGTHCRYCTAKHVCRSLQSTVYNAIDVVGASVPLQLDNAAISKELKLLRRVSKLLEYRLTAIEAEAESKIRGGEALPDFHAQPKMGRKRWKKDIDVNQIAMLGELSGVELRKAIELITPTQAKNKGIDEAVINMYSETPSTGFNVVEVDTNLSQEAFKK